MKEQKSSAYFNQKADEKISKSGAPELDKALKAELNNALNQVSDFKLISEPNQDPEINMDFESTMETLILGEEKVQPYKLERISFTAYYGPRKNQGDYYHKTFKKDVAINGPGYETACKGHPPDENTIATDPKIFPCGTKIIMEDPLTGKEKTYIAKDRGSAIKGLKIDIFAGVGIEGLRKVRLIQRKSREILVKVIRPSQKRS
ncbi:MAG: hypothetical protein HGA36_04170 [Candidatus Moranbacteria bacterium]|nr:hypothetical protein [Candidatus Moranbacteria bacterium]